MSQVMVDLVRRRALGAVAGAALVGFSHAETYPAGSLGARAGAGVSAKDAPYKAVGNGIADDTAAIQAALNSGKGAVFLPPGIYAVSAELVVPDGAGLVGAGAHWKRRAGYVYDGNMQTVIKYIGAGGANSCVVRASNTAVGIEGSDFSGPETDDLLNVVLRDFHVDANGLAHYGVYVYRAGNQATIGNLTAEKAVKANHVHLGCFAAEFGTFGAYSGVDQGVLVGHNIFGWAVEATNFAFSATYLLANNGTAATYVAGTATDLDNAGGKFSVGRGSKIRIISEANVGRACVLSTFNVSHGTAGPVDHELAYLEGNADGPYVDYWTNMDGIRLCNGFLHPGNGSTLLPQNIKIEAKSAAGVVQAGAGPENPSEWLVLERLFGDLAGVGFAVNANTSRYVVRECGSYLTYPGRKPLAPMPSEGAFNFGLAGATTAGTQTFNNRGGYYVRQGNMVYGQGKIDLLTLDGAAAGQIRLTGLPFPAKNQANLYGSIRVTGWANLATATYGVSGRIPPGADYIELTKLTAAALSMTVQLLPADLSGTASLTFSFSYIAD